MADPVSAVQILHDKSFAQNLRHWIIVHKLKHALKGTNNLNHPDTVKEKIEGLLLNQPGLFNTWRKLGHTSDQIVNHVYNFFTKIA